MKALFLIYFSTYITIIANARLIEKNTEKPSETQPTESLSAVRVSRQAYYEEAFGGSKEDNVQEEDRTYVRKGRYSMKSKTITKTPKVTKGSSEEPIKKQAKTETVQTKTTKIFIKKPIPKFNEVDYEDFQGKVNKSPVKFADSGEHEDEDFNLDDYEFDVNHDEFVGRGKPLQPRTKDKYMKAMKTKNNVIAKPTVPPPEIKIQSKVVIPTEPPQNAKKLSKKAADKMKEDYYDDVVVTTTKVPETETKRDSDDDISDTEESKEYNRKSPSRVARSAWYADLLANRMGEKTTA